MFISNAEKSQLKNRIMNSIFDYIQINRCIKYVIGAVAASIVVILSLGIFKYTNNNISPIDSFVKTLDNGNEESLKNVKLILNNDQNVNITKNNTTISYSNTGREVKIGNTKSVHQESLKNKKIVFNTLLVPYGKRSEIELADGSKVWLNSGSKLVFPAFFKGDNREVYLEGEGIFEVTHDENHPFIVKANNYEIEVLGTIFNVSNYVDDNYISTVLKSGSVQINFKTNSFVNSKNSIKITPGVMAIYNKRNKEIQTNKVEIEKYFSWRDGIFILKNDSLDQIMKKLSRYYNLNIIINDEDLANQKFSGSLDIKDNIEDVLSVIKETTNFKYDIIEGNTIIIN